MQAIRDAKSEQLMWEGVPPTSLQPDVILGDVPIEIISPLPTIQSIPELDSDGEVEIPITSSLTEMSHTRRINHRTGYAPKFDMSSRRSSATSLRMYSTSSAESSTFHLVRSNAAAREQVDRGLQDVLSERCSSARQKASTLEEDLFEAQNVTRSFSRSSSGLTMASAMSVAARNKLTRRESVLVPRRKSFLDSTNLPSDIESCAPPALHPPVRPSAKRWQPKKLKVVSMVSSDYDDDGNDLFLESPMSHCSSGSATVPVTPLNLSVPLAATLSMVDDSVTRSEFLGLRQEGWAPKRSRSMIDNVRGLLSRCGSPTSGLMRESSLRSGSSSSSLLRWWSKESIRKRSRSAPDVPPDALPTSQSLEARPQCPSIILADRPHSQPDFHHLRLLAPSRHIRHSSIEYELGCERPKGVTGFFSAKSRRSLVPDRDVDVGAVPPKVRRGGSLLRRLAPRGTSAAS